MKTTVYTVQVVIPASLEDQVDDLLVDALDIALDDLDYRRSYEENPEVRENIMRRMQGFYALHRALR